MRARVLFAAAVLCAAVGAVAAADPIKIELKDFKLTPENSEAVGLNEGDGKIFMYTVGTATAEVKLPDDGEYTLVLEMSCDEAKNEKAKVKITVGDKAVKESFTLTATEAKEYKFDVKGKKGTTKVAVEFLNDEYKENEYDRNFYLHAAKLEKKK